MILCLNLNAAIDKTVIVNTFRLGHIHRPDSVQSLPGGKGGNVARALQQFGAKPVVAGWVGGTAGKFIENGLKEEGIAADFVYTDFESRTCLSILDSETQVMTEIYEKGDPISAGKVLEMENHFRQIIGRFAAVTLSGSLPPGVPQNFYGRLIEIARNVGVPAFLDTSGEALAHGIAANPFLIKPNETEVAVLAQKELDTLDDYVAAVSSLSSRYDTIIILSLGENGAIAAKGSAIVHVKNPPVEALSAVGSGDSMLAGLTYGFQQGLSLAAAVRYGVAAGTANTLLIGAGRLRMADFERILQETVVVSMT